MCRTGNCTFTDEYTSLAYCSSCADATDELKFVQYETTAEWTDEDFNAINVTLPFSNVTLAIGEKQSLTLVRGTRQQAGPIVNLASHFGTELTMIRWDGLRTIPDKDQTITGYRCQLYPCLKTFRAKIATGYLDEEVVEVSGDVLSGNKDEKEAYRIVVADLNCLDNPEQRKILKNLGYQFDENTRWLPYNVSWTSDIETNPVFAASTQYDPCRRAPANTYSDLCNGEKSSSKALETVPARCMYTMTRSMDSGLTVSIFRAMFTGFITGHSVLRPPTYKATEGLSALYSAGSGNGTLEDVQGVFTNITDAITTYMRHVSDPEYSNPAIGVMYINMTCIQVRWAWLSYAAIIVGSLLVFFMWMVLYSRNDQSRLRKQWKSEDSVPPIHDFKSSALDLLYHGLDQEALRQMIDVGVTNQTRELEKRVENVKVTLVATDQGWKLSSVAS
ncbi:hypothetical protein NX059_009806 [Plenodomus lindquistii]|nr:hypothetical protein NX059_009806 [Plenodomus lindquistii]